MADLNKIITKYVVNPWEKTCGVKKIEQFSELHYTNNNSSASDINDVDHAMHFYREGKRTKVFPEFFDLLGTKNDSGINFEDDNAFLYAIKNAGFESSKPGQDEVFYNTSYMIDFFKSSGFKSFINSKQTLAEKIIPIVASAVRHEKLLAQASDNFYKKLNLEKVAFRKGGKSDELNLEVQNLLEHLGISEDDFKTSLLFGNTPNANTTEQKGVKLVKNFTKGKVTLDSLSNSAALSTILAVDQTESLLFRNILLERVANLPEDERIFNGGLEGTSFSPEDKTVFCKLFGVKDFSIIQERIETYEKELKTVIPQEILNSDNKAFRTKAISDFLNAFVEQGTFGLHRHMEEGTTNFDKRDEEARFLAYTKAFCDKRIDKFFSTEDVCNKDGVQVVPNKAMLLFGHDGQIMEVEPIWFGGKVPENITIDEIKSKVVEITRLQYGNEAEQAKYNTLKKMNYLPSENFDFSTVKPEDLKLGSQKAVDLYRRYTKLYGERKQKEYDAINNQIRIEKNNPNGSLVSSYPHFHTDLPYYKKCLAEAQANIQKYGGATLINPYVFAQTGNNNPQNQKPTEEKGKESKEKQTNTQGQDTEKRTTATFKNIVKNTVDSLDAGSLSPDAYENAFDSLVGSLKNDNEDESETTPTSANNESQNKEVNDDQERYPNYYGNSAGLTDEERKEAIETIKKPFSEQDNETQEETDSDVQTPITEEQEPIEETPTLAEEVLDEEVNDEKQVNLPNNKQDNIRVDAPDMIS